MRVIVTLFLSLFMLPVSIGFAQGSMKPQDHALAVQAQTALQKAGEDPGPIDGIWGPQSETALRKYQKSQGLNPTGRLDGKTLEKLLGIKVPAGAASTKRQGRGRAMAAEREKTKKNEKHFSISFEPTSAIDSVGSITFKEAGPSGLVMLSTERPGDAIMFGLSAMTGTSPSIATAEGSEVRFVGRIELSHGVIDGKKGGRLCFRKSKGAWVYVCGLGQYEENGMVTRLGYGRTVDSCLALLGSSDPILREGGARDLGRLTGAGDVARVVPKLTPLLVDASPFVRRGVAEGLGIIGSPKAFRALQQALPAETDETTKKYIEEAMGIAAAYALLKDPIAETIPLEQAKTYVSKLISKEGKIGDWQRMVITTRIAPRREQAMAALADLAASTDPDLSALAGKLKTALEAEE